VSLDDLAIAREWRDTPFQATVLEHGVVDIRSMLIDALVGQR
jgi:hypothetical protein